MTVETPASEITTIIQKATNYIAIKRGIDGSYGDIIETAYSYLGIFGTNPQDAQAQATINYLLSRQDTDGSWNKEIFDTDIVLTALHTFLNPIPSPTPIPTATPLPQTGGVHGKVIDMTYNTALQGVTVSITGSEPLIGTTTDADGRFVLSSVPIGTIELQFKRCN